MGDLRASIKIQVDMWGHKYKTDMWINYWNNGDGMDDRISEWFAECYYDAKGKYDDHLDEMRQKEINDREKAEYERLKARFTTPNPPRIPQQ